MSHVIGIALRDRAEREPDGPFVRRGGDWLLATKVDDIASRVAGGLVGLGTAKGDRVAMIVPNRQEFLEVFFACAKVGAVSVALNYWLKGEFLADQLRDCRASVLVAGRDAIDAAAPYLRDAGIGKVVALDGPTEHGFEGSSTMAYAELRAAPPAPNGDVREHDVAGMLYTSGSTGRPRGCVLPHDAYVQNARAYRDVGTNFPATESLPPSRSSTRVGKRSS